MSKEDTAMHIDGIISSVREGYAGNMRRYTILSENPLVSLNVDSREEIPLFSAVRADYTMTNAGAEDVRLKAVSPIGEGRAKLDAIIKALVSGIGIERNSKSIEGDNSKPELDEITRKMLGKLGSSGNAFIAAYFSGAPITVRFHNDGDGSTGAIGLYNALLKLNANYCIGEMQIRWVMHKGVTYNMEAFYNDSIYFSNYAGALLPRVCMIDFGTALESNPAIKASQGKCGITWLDHHPIPEGFMGIELDDYINPILYGGTADYTGGYLACIFAEAISGVKSESMKEASLISDVSRYAEPSNKEALKYATVLDFITGLKDYTRYLDGPVTPKYLIKLISDEEKLNSIYSYANEVMDDSIQIGLKQGKKYISAEGIDIRVVDFSNIADKYQGYILPGRYSSRLQSHIERNGGKGSITIVTFNNYISLRLSKHIADAIDILSIIERLKGESEYVESGGGHKEACSIKIYSEGRNEVLDLLLKELHARAAGK